MCPTVGDGSRIGGWRLVLILLYLEAVEGVTIGVMCGRRLCRSTPGGNGRAKITRLDEDDLNAERPRLVSQTFAQSFESEFAGRVRDR